MMLVGSKLARRTTTVRILAYKPEQAVAPDDHFKLVVQKVNTDEDGLCPEETLLSKMVSPQEYQDLLEASKEEGWLLLDIDPSHFKGRA